MLLAELESRIRALGYRQAYLTTGDRQRRPRRSHRRRLHRLTGPRPGGEMHAMAFEKRLLSGRLRGDAALIVSGRTSFGNPFVGCR